MTLEQDKVENNIDYDKFCNDYDFIRNTEDRQGKRNKYLKLKGYTDEQIYEGKIEYKRRENYKRMELKKENPAKKVIDLIEISKWKADKNKVTFDDIIGLDEAKRVLISRFEKYYRYVDEMNNYEVEPTSGLGLYGVPGVGKSELMKALLNKINDEIPEPKPFLLYISISDLLSGQRGEVAKMVKLMFDNIKKMDRLVVICIDEIDMIMRNKNDTNSVLTRELTSIFLQQWNGSGNVFVVFSTNNINDIEEAFISRIGYENCIECEIPTAKERRLLIDKYMKFPLTDEHRDLIVKLTNGYVGRDIKKLASPIFIVTKENVYLDKEKIDECIINKIQEINKLKNNTIEAMANNSRNKNTARKYKVIDIPDNNENNKPKKKIVINDDYEFKMMFQ